MRNLVLGVPLKSGQKLKRDGTVATVFLFLLLHGVVLKHKLTDAPGVGMGMWHVISTWKFLIHGPLPLHGPLYWRLSFGGLGS